ncbi:MAG: YkgJ family cysteine cluster protein [Myxococcota bacterium]
MKRKNKGAANRARSNQTSPAHVQRDGEGRVHLALLRDPETSQPRIVLEVPVFEEIWQNDVAAATANTVYALLGSRPSVSQTVQLGKSAMAGTSRLTEGLLEHAPPGSLACKAGCDHCCYQVVGVTAPEALTIWDHLKRTQDDAALADLVQRLSEVLEKSRGLSNEERFSPQHPCAFLRDGACSIYEVRPLSCRGMNSLSADECAQRLRDPELRARFLKGDVAGQSFMEPIRAFHAVSAGLQLGLSEIYQLDTQPLELAAAVHLLLTRGNVVARDWVAGLNSFEAARGGDSTHNAGVRALSGALSSPLATDE